jgi:TRAP-type mannitol/chloroaromatic compound transport system permease small subunit
MKQLMNLSSGIDKLNILIGRLGLWLILATTLISAGNAIVRKIFNTSSNSLLEIQWYLFAGVFLLCAGYVFQRNAHVRIDFVSSKFSERTRNWVDVVGIVAVLFPFCYLMMALSWPVFMQAYVSGEMSSNAGGLVRWPAYGLIPLGFLLLALQGVSELIKRLAFLRGHWPDPLAHDEPGSKPHTTTD